MIGKLRRRPAGLLALIAVLVAAGIYTAARLPSAIFPPVTFPIVKVIADAGEQPPARMIPTVTRPLEEAVHRVPGVRSVRSITSRGSVEMSVQFAWGTDMTTALQRTQAETQRIRTELPAETNIDVERMNTSMFPILGYALTSDTRTPAELRRLARFTLEPELIRIDGVSQIQVQGGRDREFEVHLDPDRLSARGLTAARVVQALRDQQDVLSAGLIQRNHELYLSLVDGRVHDLRALSELAVPVDSGPPPTLADLGTVSVADEVSYVRTTADNRPAVLVNVIRQPTANTVAIAGGIRKLLKDRPDLIPSGVHWAPFYDQARFVSASVSGTLEAILIGFLLAALVLAVFLRRLSTTVIAAMAIPVTVAIVGLLVGASGDTTNLMTLSGVAAAIGLVADDAIVVIEHIETWREEGWPGVPAEAATMDLLPALVGSSLSTTVILVPFALLSGVTGAFFRPLALTMALALTVSFFVAFLAVPVVASRFARSGEGRRRRGRDRDGAAGGEAAGGARTTGGGGSLGNAWERLAGRASRLYDAGVGLFLDHGWLAVGALLVLLAAGWLLYRGIGTDFLPSMDEGSIILDYRTPAGTSLSETDEMLNHVERVITSLPDVRTYSRRTGTELGFFVTEPNTGDYVIDLKPRGERRPIDEVIDDLRERIARVEPAVETDFGQLIEDDIGDLTGGEPQPIDIKIFGEEPDVLRREARRVADVISDIPGVEDVFDGIVISGPSLDLRVHPSEVARYGLTTRDIHAAVEPAVIGTVAGQVRVGDRMYDLRVFTDTTRGLEGLKVRARTPPDALVPLGRLATTGTGEPEAEIDRENLATYVGVTARQSGRDLGSIMSDVRDRIGRDVGLAPGHRIEYGGLYREQQRSFRDLLYILVAGLVLVGIIVTFEFGDWRAPLLTAACAAAVLAGVFAALHLTGKTLNISSYVGAILMIGIVGENVIFVIHEARRGLREGLDPRKAWRRASRRRLRPVSMTILATGFALAPLALAVGGGAQLMQPLAIGVIGGFVLSGPIVLLLLPGLYRLLDPRGKLAGE